MTISGEATDSQICSPCWCEFYRPPPIPTTYMFQNVSWRNAWTDLLENKTVSDAIDEYARLCPGHIVLPYDPTVGPSTPTVSSASVTTVLIVLLLVLVLAGLVIAFVVYYKKKHGRYFLRGRCQCCTSAWTRMMSAKFGGKYFRRYSSKNSKKEIIEINHADEKGNYLSYENQECILMQTDQYDGSLENHQISVHSAPQNSVTQVNHARPNDYVDYSNIPPVQTEVSTKQERLSNNQEHNYTEPEKHLSNQENIPYKPERTEEESNPDPPERVKRRKKRSKLKRNNKVQSSPEHESDVGVAGLEEADKRKTF